MQEADKIAIGDRVAVWSAGGRGIVAVGECISEVSRGRQLDDGYWTGRPPAEPLPKVLLFAMWSNNPVPGAAMAADPQFEGSEILRQAFATNPFRVEPDEWSAIVRQVEELNPGALAAVLV
ncbi:MAG TPA: EVE domain-containing protein [Mycobacterium sp.]|nr:EVE domain-containing protein [Mycobacterium sp.]